MTLAFELAALRRLADPGVAFADAGEWADRVGVVAGEAPDRAVEFASREGLTPDFVSGRTGEAEGLGVLGRQYPTDRHVLVGTSDEHRAAARSFDWEYLDVESAAAEADWRLAAADDRWRSDR